MKAQMNDGRSQKAHILEYMQQGYSITPLDALLLFNCLRLGARIADLRADGHPIDREMVCDPDTGKRYASYSMKED